MNNSFNDYSIIETEGIVESNNLKNLNKLQKKHDSKPNQS